MKYFCIFIIIFTVGSSPVQGQSVKHLFEEASSNAQLANEGFRRCDRYLSGWLANADARTGLIPRNLTESRDYWNAFDAAADNYPFMVLTASMLHNDLFKNRMLNMLHTEQKLTSRIGRLPDTYSFSKRGFLYPNIDTSRIIFGSLEYMKDGLIPLTEWLGSSPWSERMIGILDDLDKIIQIPIQLEGDFYGNSANVEATGDLLQVLSRMYWMTGDADYLERAVEIGDYYFSDNHLPTSSLDKLRLRDHGCEIISGLTEIYATMHFVDKAKKMQWKPYLYKMLDCILEKGRNEDGLFYNVINPVTGEVIDNGIADTWGYTFNAYYTVYLIDGKTDYRDAVLKALHSLERNYSNYDWEHGSSDGDADAIEGGLNLYFYEPIPSVKNWMDNQVQVMWAKQQPSGIIEGWHGDGNFARTTLMYCLWKTAGITVSNWEEGVFIGAVVNGQDVYVSLKVSDDWMGEIKFGEKLHSKNLNLPINYPRTNQFQEWYPIDPEATYRVSNIVDDSYKKVKGKKLISGYAVALLKNEALNLLVTKEQEK